MAACKIIAGEFAKGVQCFLMLSGIALLLFKRHREYPQRPLIVWFMDTSKQAFGGVLQHVVNIALALTLKRGAIASECIWYFINFFITIFCGLFILHFMMKSYNSITHHYDLKYLTSGYYGEPPQVLPWMLQMLLWGIMACTEKLITVMCVILPLHAHLDAMGVWLEQPFTAKESFHLELVLVMVVAPTLLNFIFFWVVDNLIKDDRVQRDELQHPFTNL